MSAASLHVVRVFHFILLCVVHTYMSKFEVCTALYKLFTLLCACHHCTPHPTPLDVQAATEQLSSSASSYWGTPLLQAVYCSSPSFAQMYICVPSACVDTVLLAGFKV